MRTVSIRRTQQSFSIYAGASIVYNTPADCAGELGMLYVRVWRGPDDVSVQMARPRAHQRELDAHRLPAGGATDTHRGGWEL